MGGKQLKQGHRRVKRKHAAGHDRGGKIPQKTDRRLNNPLFVLYEQTKGGSMINSMGGHWRRRAIFVYNNFLYLLNILGMRTHRPDTPWRCPVILIMKKPYPQMAQI
jgi:hypothetical protein